MSDIITTIENADIELQKLIDNNNLTEESVQNFIKRLSLDAGNGEITVLYSAAGDLTTGLMDDPNIRDSTPGV